MEKYSDHPLAGAKDLDSAMNMLWSFYKKYFVVLYIISVISSLIGNYINSTLDLTALQSKTDPMEMLAEFKGMAGPYFLMMLISVVFGIIIHSYILDKPMESSYNFIDSLRKSAIAFFPYILAVIVMGIGGLIMIAVGFMLLVIPGLFAIFYFATICIFALPVVLVESRNPGNIIGRSVQLSHRNLWPNLGWTSVIILIVIIFSVVIAGIIMLPFSGTFIKTIMDPSSATGAMEVAKNPVYIILSSLAGSLVTPVLPIMAFILYFKNAGEESKAEAANNNDDGRVRVEDLYPKMPEND
jgi:hypothetical protein